MTHVLAIDIETTGPGVHSHRMVAWGAVIVEVFSKKVVSEFGAFMPLGDHSKGRPDATWDERTYREFWVNAAKRTDGQTPLAALQATMSEYEDHIMSQDEAAKHFVAWARTQNDTIAGGGGKLVIVSDTVSFDTTFVNAALDRATDVPNLVELFGTYRPVRDVSSFYFGVGRQTPAMGMFGSEKAVFTALGDALDRSALPSNDTHDHNPVNDARYIALVAAHVYGAIEAPTLERDDASTKKQKTNDSM